MLVLSRQRDEAILVGDEQTAFVQVMKGEEELLKAVLACKDLSELVVLLQKKLKDAKPEDRTRHFDMVKAFIGKVVSAPRGPAEIMIVDIRGDKTRLGVTLNAHVPVHRKEVYEQLQREARERDAIAAKPTLAPAPSIFPMVPVAQPR